MERFTPSRLLISTILTLVLCESSSPATNSGKLPLNNFIRYYEALRYDASDLESSHQRARRSTTYNGAYVPEVRLNFFAHGREFRIRLVQDKDTLDSQSMVVVDIENHESDFSHIYQGHLEGEPSSYVHGSIINGIFAGQIDTSGKTYYIDKSHLHFKEEMPFHSFIYSSDDVLHPLPDRFHQKSSSCGLQNSGIHEWMNKVQNSAAEKPLEKKPQHSKMNIENSYWMYHYGEKNRRERRQADKDKRMCSLLLQSDPALWDYMKNKTSRLGYSDSQVRDEITALFASHVSAIKNIYSNTTFQYTTFGPFTGITFAVHRMQINSSDSCKTNPNANPFCKPNIDVSNFLNLNSLANHDLYCLAIVFTYRDFAQGTLGLAWVGSNSRTSGGICEKFKPYIENNKEVYKSLNTGIVTLSNYGSRVPTRVSQLTFAHEVGHGFGSPHDSGGDCVPLSTNPSDPRGNYIMYASATSGDKPNNQQFSKCSIGNMTLVISAVMNEQNGKVNCFKQPSQSFCGNRIVEVSEECDCGFEEDCSDPQHPDNCCYPQSSGSSASVQCRRKPNASCSPSEGKCCVGSSCSFVPASENVTCLEETDCNMKSSCNGSSARCPTAMPKAELSLCNNNTQICRKGECTGSVCEKIGWSVCYLVAATNDKSFDRGQLCYVSCMNPATNSCVTTGNQEALEKQENKPLQDLLKSLQLSNNGIRMPPGAPCDNYRGYCDVFLKCRSVNEDGPLARLTNLLFSQQALTTVRDWITVHWWAVLLMGVGFIVGMGLFVKCCAVHTPSSNPNQKPARKMSDLTLTRRNYARQQASSGNSVDRQPIHPEGQGARAGKRTKKQSTEPPKHHSTRHSQANNENLEMRPPPHYDNRLVFDQI